MELIERPNLKAVKFLNSIKYEEFKTDCIKDAEENGDKKPTDKDIKTWFSILQQFCKTNIKTKGITKRIYAYSQTTPAGLGGRLFSGGSLQGIWGCYRALCMRDIATDIDMSNCHPVLLKFICNKHNILCPNLEYYINNRDKCLAEFPNKNTGKKAYLVATNNDKISRRPDLPQAFKLYDKEMKQIQKTIISLPDYKTLQETIPEYKLLKNYNGSAINRVLCYYENIVLQHALHIINSKGLETAILMFDGLMVYGDHYDNMELLEEIEKYVEEQMEGLNMKWAYKQHDETLQIPEDFDETKENDDDKTIIANTDNDACLLLYENFKNNIIVIDKRLFMKKENIWIDDADMVENHILKHILNSNIYCKKGDDIKPFVQNIKSAKNVRETLINKLKTEDELQKSYELFHTTTKNRMAFLDGVLDFKTKKFYKWEDVNFPYFTTVQIKRNFYEYFLNPNQEVINNIKNIVFDPLFGCDTTKALNFFSRGLAGNCEDKNWATYIGNRDCGKGVFYDALKFSFEDYVKSFELGNIMYERKTNTEEVSRKLYWLMDFEFVRVGISQEIPAPSMGLKVDGKMLKKLAGGGDSHTARRNFDRFDTEFKIDTTFCFMGNNELTVDVKDAYEHCVEFSSVNQFKSAEEIQKMRDEGEDELVINSFKIKDIHLKTQVQTDEWKNAIVMLFFQHHIDKAIEVFKMNSDEDDETNVCIRKQIINRYEITRDKRDVVLCEDIYNYIEDCKKKVNNEMVSLGVTKKRCNESCNYRNKMCYYGLKLKIPQIQPEDECEEE